MRNHLLLLFSILNLNAFSQTKQVAFKGVFEPNSQKTYWFHTQNGDMLTVDIKAGKRQRISSIEVMAYPDKIIFAESNFKVVEEQFNFIDTQFYKVTIKNDRDAAIKIDASLQFTSKEALKKVQFRPASDTTYGYQTTMLRKVENLLPQTVQSDKFFLNSRSNAVVKGGKNRVLLPINLPQNTVEWYYVLTASRDENEVKNTRNTFNLASELTKYVDNENSLKQAVTTIAPPPSANICDVYLLDESNAKLFKEKEDFEYDITSSRENYKSGIINVKKANANPVFIGINNSNNIYGIHVGIEVVAIVKDQNYLPEERRIPIITSFLQPYVD
ncbi:hypothetical protein ACFQ1M_12275 [Sungkyunkwania multivorans]|uniref:DUF4138 domain-containing protein n=1 Tax=Sungkyunkwania multivorans TaxID=1173618 RepID=A0ABW3D1I9_9FLAO